MPTTWAKIYYDTSRQDQLTVSVDDSGNVTLQRIFTLVAVAEAGGAQPTLTEALTASAGGLPVPTANAVYTFEGQLYRCTQVYPRRAAQTPFAFEIQVTYTAKYLYQPTDLSAWNVEISISGAETTQPAWQATDGADSDLIDIVNSAGQAFDPSVDETLYDEQITLSYSTAAPPDFSALRGMVNSDTVTFSIQGLSRTYEPNTLLLKDATMSTTTNLADGVTAAWKVQVTLLAREDSFVRQILDQGYYELNSDGDLVAIKDKYGDLVSAPVRLDGSGAALDSGADPVYLPFLIEGQAALSGVFDGLA